MHYYIVDTETTGLQAGHHEIFQISIIRVADRVQFNRNIRVKFPERASAEALKVTGKKFSDLYQGHSSSQVVTACEDFLAQDQAGPEARCFVAHNASFDRRFLHAMWKAEQKFLPVVCWLDTMALYKKYAKNYLGLSKFSSKLGSALQTCQIKFAKQMHSSVTDTQATYFLYQFLMDQKIDYLPLIVRKPHGD